MPAKDLDAEDGATLRELRFTNPELFNPDGTYKGADVTKYPNVRVGANEDEVRAALAALMEKQNKPKRTKPAKVIPFDNKAPDVPIDVGGTAPAPEGAIPGFPRGARTALEPEVEGQASPASQTLGRVLQAVKEPKPKVEAKPEPTHTDAKEQTRNAIKKRWTFPEPQKLPLKYAFHLVDETGNFISGADHVVVLPETRITNDVEHTAVLRGTDDQGLQGQKLWVATEALKDPNLNAPHINKKYIDRWAKQGIIPDTGGKYPNLEQGAGERITTWKQFFDDELKAELANLDEPAQDATGARIQELDEWMNAYLERIDNEGELTPELYKKMQSVQAELKKLRGEPEVKPEPPVEQKPEQKPQEPEQASDFTPDAYTARAQRVEANPAKKAIYDRLTSEGIIEEVRKKISIGLWERVRGRSGAGV